MNLRAPNQSIVNGLEAAVVIFLILAVIGLLFKASPPAAPDSDAMLQLKAAVSKIHTPQSREVTP